MRQAIISEEERSGRSTSAVHQSHRFINWLDQNRWKHRLRKLQQCSCFTTSIHCWAASAAAAGRAAALVEPPRHQQTAHLSEDGGRTPWESRGMEWWVMSDLSFMYTSGSPSGNSWQQAWRISSFLSVSTGFAASPAATAHAAASIMPDRAVTTCSFQAMHCLIWCLTRVLQVTTCRAPTSNLQTHYTMSIIPCMSCIIFIIRHHLTYIF